MSNLARLYTDITTKPSEEKKEQPIKEEDAGHAQLRINWANSTITKELSDSIDKNIDVCMVEAIQHAVNYPVHENHHKIIQLLVRIDTMIKTKAKMFKVESK